MFVAMGREGDFPPATNSGIVQSREKPWVWRSSSMLDPGFGFVLE